MYNSPPVFAMMTTEVMDRPGSVLKPKPKPRFWGRTERKPKFRFWQGVQVGFNLPQWANGRCGRQSEWCGFKPLSECWAAWERRLSKRCGWADAARGKVTIVGVFETARPSQLITLSHDYLVVSVQEESRVCQCAPGCLLPMYTTAWWCRQMTSS